MVESIQSSDEIVSHAVLERPIRVLHVDDDSTFLKVAKQCLEMQGKIEVNTASSVNEALENLKKTDYDAIVSDYQLPGKDGLEFLKELRKKGNTVPFIVLTGKGREEVAIKALNLGADQYVDKHGDPATVYHELVHAIHQAVDRKSAQIELLRREAKLKAILESSPEAITVTDLDGNVVECNQAAVDMHGGQSREDLIGKNAFGFIAEKDHERAIQNLKKTLEQGCMKTVEYSFVAKDGREFPGELSSSVVRDASGKPEYFVAITKDITERRLMEQRYATIVKTALDGFWINDSKGRFIAANDAYSRMIGYTREELLSMSIQEIEVLEKTEETAEHIEKTLREGHDHFETRHRRKDGTVIDVEVSANYYPVDEGQLVVFIRNITERKRTEEIIKRRLEYERIVSAVSSRFVGFSNIDESINASLSDIGSVSGASRAYLFLLDEDRSTMSNAHEWCAKGVKPQKNNLQNVPCALTPWWMNKLDKNETIHVEDVSRLPEEAKAEKGMFEKQDIKSLLAFPLNVKGKLAGFIGFDNVVESGEWSDDDAALLRVSAEIVGHVLERQKGEEELRRSTKRFRTIFENARDSMIYLDGSGRVLDFNRKTLEIFGGTRQELVGKHFAKLGLFSIKEIPSLMRNLADILAGRRVNVDLTIKNKKGQGVHLECSASVFAANDKSTRILVIARDITERSKVQEELKAMNDRLNTLFEFAPDAYYLNDLKGNFADGNKAAEEVTGYAKDELIGKSFLKLKLLPRSQALKAAKLLALNALGKSTGPDEFVLNRKDGTKVPVEIRTYPVRIKNQTLVLGIARDITARKKDEQAIRESQQKFEGLFEHNPEATVYLDSDFRILDVNPRFRQLFGYSAKEAKGKRINEVVAPEAMMEEADRLNKDAKKGYVSRDTVRKRKDASLMHVSISAAPVTIEGRLLGYVGVYKDITDVKDTEERLKETNKRLKVTNEKLHVVGSLTRHDVRNKLSAVTGNAYLLRPKLAGDTEALEQLSDMEAAVRLVERIFEFARTYEKLGVEQLASVDVGKAVDEAASLFSDLKGVKIVNECRGLTVMGDSLLRQLFYNLIDNSLKYGEKIREIKVYYRTPSADKLEIVYKDDGVGIPDNMRSNIFKEGFASGKGTGYGLFMIRRICEVYGWTIRETGRQGQGVQFTMTIQAA